MTERSSQHVTFVIERQYPVSPARVFGAWADPVAKARWFNGPAPAQSEGYLLDFRVGGTEHLTTLVPGEPPHVYAARYYDIVPGQRIVYCYEMRLGQTRISVSLATAEFRGAGKQATLIFTEQAVFFDGYDDRGSRERGTNELLDKLGRELS
jgi:uncharacterized protein YndB with AHSA1/START domain